MLVGFWRFFVFFLLCFGLFVFGVWLATRAFCRWVLSAEGGFVIFLEVVVVFAILLVAIGARGFLEERGDVGFHERLDSGLFALELLCGFVVIGVGEGACVAWFPLVFEFVALVGDVNLAVVDDDIRLEVVPDGLSKVAWLGSLLGEE